MRGAKMNQRADGSVLEALGLLCALIGIMLMIFGLLTGVRVNPIIILVMMIVGILTLVYGAGRNNKG